MGVYNPNERPPRRQPAQKQAAPVLAALLANRVEHQAVPPLQPAPARYYRPYSPASGTAKILAGIHETHDLSGLTQTIRRDEFARRSFPYTTEKQVAYANASGDLQDVLARAATETGGAAPEIHPSTATAPVNNGSGRIGGLAGFAYRGRNDIYLTPIGYMSPGDAARGIALHEMGHTRQAPLPAPKWQIEGGADYLANALSQSLGLPQYRPGYPAYYERYRQMPPSRASRTALIR